MAIKVTIPEGQTHVKASDLYQWDYGQVLEIEAPKLPTVLEVHFACREMSEAVIHTCSAVNNVASVVIPDQCLENASEITAWVYEIDGTAGRTLYRITIPVIARTRPSRGESIPVEVQDSYTQLITEVNEAVGKIANGEIVVAKAAHATSADRAQQADNASSAASAASANFATRAATADGYQKADRGAFLPTMYLPAAATGDVYQFKVTIDGLDCYAILTRAAGKTAQASLGWIKGTEEKHYILRVTDSTTTVWSLTPGAEMALERTDLAVYFRQI